MNIYSWFTSKEKDDGGWYKCQIMLVFPKQTFKCNTYPFYKPNRKGKPKAKRNKLFNDSMRLIYGRKWPDVKKILKNTTEIEIKDIRGIKDSQNLVELLFTPTPIMEFAQEIYNYETPSKEMALRQSRKNTRRNERSGTKEAP